MRFRASPELIAKAAGILQKGRLVAFPTETVYGLGADAFNARAVAKIFQAKKRPSFDPIIVHVADPHDVRLLWKRIPKTAQLLMKAFWPGPLTLVLLKTKKVPDIVTAGLDTVAVRMPNHPMALELIRKLGRPIAAPSANVFGRTSPTTAEAVRENLGKKVDLVLDGGPCAVGLESTVLKIENNKAILLRPGGISVEEIRKFTPVVIHKREGSVIYSPGQLPIHYAPKTPFRLMDKGYGEFLHDLKTAFDQSRKTHTVWPRIGLLSFNERPKSKYFKAVRTLSRKKNLNEAAANLFEAIRKLDKMKLDFIVAERVPRNGIGLAIMDRLQKASGGKKGVKY